MKKYLIVAFFLLFFGTILSAQDCIICGDWQGHYEALKFLDDESEMYEDCKLYIRIKPNGESMIVRTKRECVSGETFYEDKNIVSYDILSPNNIGWSYHFDTDYEPGNYKGNWYDKVEFYSCYLATVTNNSMVCTYWLRFRYLRKTTTNTQKYGYEEWWVDVGNEDFQKRTYVLYKDDGDW